jgi:hypothetical protein
MIPLCDASPNKTLKSKILRMNCAINFKALSESLDICKNDLSATISENQKEVETCNLEKQKIFENHKKGLLNPRSDTDKEQVIREKNTIILGLTIIIVLLLIIIIAQSVKICKLKTKNAAKKEEIIRLDRLAPKHIYEPVGQKPEHEYEEVK